MATTGRKPGWGEQGKYLIEKRPRSGESASRWRGRPWGVWGPNDQVPFSTHPTFGAAVAAMIQDSTWRARKR